MKSRRFSFALQISILYALFGGLWILLSDKVALALFANPGQLTQAQTYEGWFFILVTALLLFILISHKTRSQKEIRKRHNDLFDSIAEGTFRSSPEGQFISVNTTMARLYGYSSPAEMLEAVKDTGTQIQFAKEDHGKFIEALNQNGAIDGFETQSLRKDGSVFWVSINARAVQDENGEILYYEGFVTDITERKITESNLIQTEARYKAIVEQVPAAVYTDALDKNSSNFFSSPQIFNITGYSSREWIEDPELWTKLIHPEDRQRVLEESERINLTREPFDIQYRIISRDGRIVWVHDRASLIWDEDGNPLYWQGLLVDVTSQQHAEEAIRASEVRYHTLVEQASDAIFISDAQGKYFEVNQRACDLLGFSRAELLGLTLQDLLPAEELAVRPLKLHELTSGRTIVSERALLRKDQTLIPVELSTKMLPDGMLMSIVRDVTERKLSQETLARSEQRFRSLIEHSMDAIALYTAEGKILYQSPASLRILGYTLPEMLGHYALEYIHPDDRQQAMEVFEQVLKSPGNNIVVELRYLHKDGTTRWIEIISTNRTNEPGVNAIVANYRDTTERKLAEEALRRREAILEAVGFAAEQFLKSPDWEDCLPRVLERLGNTTQTSRVYVFKKHFSADNALLISQLFEWCSEGIESQLDNQTLQSMDFAGAGYTRWIKLFNEGMPAYGIVKHLPPEEQVEFSREGILSIICFPIIVEGDWWGFIGFDDCRTEREWSAVEIETLRAAVSTLGAAIQRKSTEEALSRSEISYRGLFNSVQDAIYILNEEGCFLDVNEGAVHMHGQAKEYFIGRAFGNLSAAGKNNLESVTQSFRMAFQGEPQQFEFWGAKNNGGAFPEEIRLYKGVYFGEEVVIAVAHDISERKRAEDALQRQLNELMVLHAAAMAESSAGSSDELIQRVTDIIGDALYSDNCGVLLLDKTGTALQPHFSYRGTNTDNIANIIPLTLGISGKVAATGKPARVGNVKHDPSYYEVTTDIRSELCVPVFSGKKLFGVLNVESKQENAFTDADERLLNTIAGGIATALEKLQLFDLEKKRRQEADTLREATAALTTSVEPKKVFELILDTLSTIVTCSSASVELIDGGQIEIVAQHGLSPDHNIVSDKYDLHLGRWGGDLGKLIVIPDVRKDSRFDKFEGAEYIRSWMGVPLITQDKLIGYLNLDSATVGYFTDEHAALVQTFANHAATAIEHARIFQEERRRTRIIEVLADIANEIATTGEIDSMLDKVARRSLDLLKASTVAIYILQDDDITIKPVTARGMSSREILSHLIGIGEGITGNIILTGKSEIINDTTKDTRRILVPGTSEEDGRLETMMSSPLIVRGKPIGAINAWRLRSDGLFNESELNFLISIAHQTSISIESGRLFQETVRRAQEAAAIAEVGRDISATLQLDLVLERIAVYAKELLGSDTSAVYLYEPATHSLHAIAAIGFEAEEVKNDPLTIGRGILGNIALNKIGEIVNETATDPRGIVVKGTLIDPYEHIMGVPVLNMGELTGLLVVWQTGMDKEFVQGDLDFLTSLAQQAAVAIENARLFQAEQKRRQEAENLSIAATAITSTLEPAQVLETILVALQQVVPYDSAAIFQFEGKHMRITAAKGFLNKGSVINRVFPSSNRLFLEIRQSSRPLILEDSQTNPHFENWAVTDTVHGWMGIPLIARGQVIGCITIDSFTPGAFNENDATLAQTFAHQAAAAIENSRLFTETRQRMEELEVVSRVSVALRVAQDSEKMLVILLREIKKSMNTDTAAIWLYDRDKEELIQKAASGKLGNLQKPDIKPGEGIVGNVFASGKTHVTLELTDDPEALPENTDVFGKGWGAISVPIQTTSGTIGALMVAIHSSRRIESHHISLMKTVAEIAGNAINRSNLFEKSEEQVRRLTTLREMDTAISSSFDLRVTLDILVKHLLSKMGVSATAILILNPDSQTLNFHSGGGFRDQESLRMQMQTGDSLANQILLTQKEIYIQKLEGDPQSFFMDTLKREEFVSYYGVPLHSKGLVRGVLETYFRQPFTPSSDWREFVHTIAGQATIAIDNTHLFENLQRSNQELSLAYDTTLEGWGKALELRDKETQGHTRRVTDMTLELARRMGIPESQLTHIRRGVLLHDIGKMGVPDNILRKEGPLTDEEWGEMRKHPQYAFDLLHPIHYLRPVLDIAYCHHEWWDGSGYPSGLKGNDIPLPARIFAVVDVWDALLSNRPYRSSWTKQKVLQYIRNLAGKQFDPAVVETFLKMMKGMKLPALPRTPARRNLTGEISTPPPKKSVKKPAKKKMR